MKIPYGMLPRHWGAKGKKRDIEKAEYELTGEILDRRLAEINIDDEDKLAKENLKIDLKYDLLTKKEFDHDMASLIISDKIELAKENLNINRKHKKISKEEYDYSFAKLEYKDDVMGQSLAQLELDKKYKKISEAEYEKGVASLNGEPWVGVINSEYNPGEATDGFSFELDWNDAFVEMLTTGGYEGGTPEQIVEGWFEAKAIEEYMHIISEMAEDEFDDTIPKTIINRQRFEDGTTRHS